MDAGPVIVFAVVIFAIGVFARYKIFKGLSEKEPQEREKIIIIERVDFVYNPQISKEENMIDFMHAYARMKKLPEQPREQVEYFFFDEIPGIATNFSDSTGRICAIFDDIVEKASQTYSVTPIEESHSAKAGEHLTPWEMYYVSKTGRCPDCKSGEFEEGPGDGIETNCKCVDCGAMFSIYPIFDASKSCRITEFISRK